MTDKGKISGYQVAMMMFLLVGATGILVVPAITAKHAARDMWMSPIWGSISGFLSTYIAVQLHNLYPKKNIIQYSEIIMGKFFGKIIGFFVLFFLLHGSGGVIREYGEFIVGTFLHQTPIVLVMGCLAISSGFAVRSGVEVLARCTEIFFPVLILIFMLLVLLLIPNLEPRHMLPVMENGWMPSLEGSMVPHTWFIQYFLISFLLPYLDHRNGMKWGMVSVASLTLILVIANFICLFLFGEKLSGTFEFPVYIATRYISVADFIAHVESIAMAFWIVGGFVQISLWYYSLLLGTSQWLGLNDYRSLAFPIGLLIVMNSIWGTRSLQELVMFLSTTAVFYKFFILLGIPLMLLCITLIRKSRKRAAL